MATGIIQIQSQHSAVTASGLRWLNHRRCGSTVTGFEISFGGQKGGQMCQHVPETSTVLPPAGYEFAPPCLVGIKPLDVPVLKLVQSLL
jgi:hypothetical protein